ncbi:lytic transglycosylase domain-containing protein [Roseomonas frigidaquae]|uniref:Lytic transglycosylase domain-containing protein n=1 Tax=Falsiroseomonas frigidaquae TaxID=487318 RepID=A0ABX1F878_9PROT|nr:lytic transglycosylase domain-containing protein [Falsiroseomonas frigidaquae]
MILELAAFLELAAACAPGVAPETLAAIARVESGLDPLIIGINERGAAPVRSATPAEAATRATALIEAGKSVDLGLMQINSRNLGWLGLAVEDAFDPCRSIAAGARVLTAFSAYNTGSPSRGLANGYVARVVSARAAMAAAPARPSPAPLPGPAPAACAPSWDVWARCPAAAPAPRNPDPADADEQAPPSAEPVRLRGSLAMGADTR